MGGKTGTTTQSVSIPPAVLARYNSVNAQAQNVASTPFQQYSQDPNAFVSPVNQQQYAGIGNINQAANMAQPYYGTAGALTMAGAGGVSPDQYSGAAMQQYMNPYISNVANATSAQMQNLFGQQAQQLKGEAINAGAFGGDRAGIAQGNLANQQALAYGQTMGNIYNTGFGQAQQEFNTQQGVNLAAQQADQARLLAAGQQLGGLGGAAQQSALAGAQAQLGAGALEQQTQQAGQTALYNQFLQQQAYPFQVAQFLANIAEGTGALSGSTTTTTQPMPFFSDRRLKTDIKKIGEAKNGLPIYSYKYKGDDQTHIGFMADEVEHVHPEAVGLAGGYKTVDYDKASRPARYSGGLVQSEGGAVMPSHMGEGFAVGGIPSSVDTASLMKTIGMQENMPVTGGGIDNNVANAARALSPAPFVPPSVSAPQGYNPFADPKYQPDIGSATTTHDYGSGSHSAGGLGNAAYNNPFSDATAGSHGTNPYSGGPTYGGYSGIPESSNTYSEASGGRIPRAGGGGFDLDSILANQGSMYSDLAKGAHGSTSRNISTGQGGTSHTLMTAGAPPRAPESTMQQLSGLIGGPSGAINLAKEGSALYDKFSKTPPSAPPAKDVAAAAPALDASAGKVDVPPADIGSIDDTLSLFKSHGGLAGYAAGGTPEGLYSGNNSGSLDIPDDSNWQKDQQLQKSQMPSAPGASGGSSGFGDVLNAAKLAASFFLKDGGRAGYDNGGATYDEPGLHDYGQIEFPLKNSRNEPTAAPVEPGLAPKNVDVEPTASIAQKPAAASEPAPKPPGLIPQAKEPVPMTPPEKAATAVLGQAKNEPGWFDNPDNKNLALSILAGLGTMAGSNSRYLGSALLQGLGGGAQTYAALQKQAADVAHTQAATEAEKATAAATQAEAKVRTAQLYDKQFVPGVGWYVYDKTNPLSAPKLISDANGKPLAGIDPSEIPVTNKQQPVPGAPVAPVPTEKWAATTAIPDKFVPPQQTNIVMGGSLKDEAASAAGLSEQQRQKAQQAYNQQYQLAQMTEAFNQLPKEGFLTPGAYGDQRLDIAKKANTIASILGAKPFFDPNDVGAIEEIKKGSFRLGSALASSMGHEPGFIVQQAVGANPGFENTPAGYKRIAAGLAQAAQREVDESALFDNYRARFGHLNGAVELFNQINPPQKYADKAIVSTVSPEDAAALREYAAKYKDPSKAAAVIDKTYGDGAARAILGGQ